MPRASQRHTLLWPGVGTAAWWKRTCQRPRTHTSCGGRARGGHRGVGDQHDVVTERDGFSLPIDQLEVSSIMSRTAPVQTRPDLPNSVSRASSALAVTATAR